MEYYGKILCISKDDLTRDDRPICVDGVVDYSQCGSIDEVHPSMKSREELAPIMSESCFKLLVYRKKMQIVRKGVGRGVYALVSVDSLPDKYKKLVEQKYGSIDRKSVV